ncbi:MAG: cell wall assembly protein [Micavibrio sp.]|nr:MAG: cell wall assembly protein [Micavibrio sp.]
MSKADEIIARLKSLAEEVPIPKSLPSEDQVLEIEKSLGLNFHDDFKKYLLAASNVVFGIKEPVQITNLEAHDSLTEVIENSKAYELPQDVLPICHDNADFYCLTSTGEVLFWSHDISNYTEEKWSNIWEWIEQVWINEYLEGESE